MIRMVLIGKTGVGKSATGNTILGTKTFERSPFSKSVTKFCQKGLSMIESKIVQIIDTPGLYDTELPNEKEIREEIGKCITMSSPGPHVFLLLITIGRFTEEEKQTLKLIQEIFGECSKAYTMVGFTHGELLKEDNIDIDTYINQGCQEVKDLIKDCGNRYHVFCNSPKDADHQQIKSLLMKVDNMIKTNGGRFYSTDMYIETERRIRHAEIKVLHEKFRDMEREISDGEQQIRELKEQLQKAEYENAKKAKKLEQDISSLKEKMIDEITRSLAKRSIGHEQVRKEAEKTAAVEVVKKVNPKCRIS